MSLIISRSCLTLPVIYWSLISFSADPKHGSNGLRLREKAIHSTLLLLKRSNLQCTRGIVDWAQSCNEWRGPSSRLNAWATKLRKNVAAVASCVIWPARIPTPKATSLQLTYRTGSLLLFDQGKLILKRKRKNLFLNHVWLSLPCLGYFLHISWVLQSKSVYRSLIKSPTRASSATRIRALQVLPC